MKSVRLEADNSHRREDSQELANGEDVAGWGLLVGNEVTSEEIAFIKMDHNQVLHRSSVFNPLRYGSFLRTPWHVFQMSLPVATYSY